MLLIFQNNLTPPIQYGGKLKKFNGTSWALTKLRNYNGINVAGKPLNMWDQSSGTWKTIQQAP